MGSRGQSAGPQALSQWRDDEDDGFGDFDVAPKSQKPEPDRIAKYREAEDNDAFMDDLIFGGDEQIIHEVTGSSGVDLRQLVADSSPQQQGGPKLFKLDDLSKYVLHWVMRVKGVEWREYVFYELCLAYPCCCLFVFAHGFSAFRSTWFNCNNTTKQARLFARRPPPEHGLQPG